MGGERSPGRHGGRPRVTQADDYRWVDRQADFDDLLERFSREERYALDTEFHRERTYFPRLALLQLAIPGEIALVDPLKVDVHAMQSLFASDSVAVLHAAQQDLDVLTHACGAVPRRLFDTQLAAGFVGYSTPSLSSLVQGELGVTVTKGDRLTDWLHRPLTDAQRTYAAGDVLYLLELHDLLLEHLATLGRGAWAEEACEELRTRPVSGADPESAWERVKDMKNLRPKSRGVARAVAAWRERRAMELDIPVRQVLPDLAVLGIAQRAPRTVEELSGARGVDRRHLGEAISRQLLEAVAEGRERPIENAKNGHDDLARSLRPAVTLVSAWVAELAHRERLDTTLLATRADLVALIRGDEDARLREGWRSEVLGDQVERLLRGAAGLTFDEDHGLRLINVTP